MNKENLLIQFFEKRKDFDDRYTEGGGDSQNPNWVLSGSALSQRSEQLNNEVAVISQKFKENIDKKARLPLVVSTTIFDKAIAKSHRSEIEALFEDENQKNILGFSGDRCLLSTISSKSVIDYLSQTLTDQNHCAKTISSITAIAPFQPFIDKYDESVEYYKVRLIDYNNYDVNCISKILFEEECLKNGITIKQKTKYTSDMTIYRVCVDSASKMELLKNFEGIHTIEKMQPIKIVLDSLIQYSKIKPKKPLNDVAYPIVGVLDTGISNTSYLDDWVIRNNYPNYPTEYLDVSHGTFVSGIIEYGDELNNSSYTKLSGVRLFDAAIYPDENKEIIYPDDLVEHIREAIERNSDIKIWNLSLGTADEASLSDFSDFGMALDNIQDENNVLIVKSAGNCTNFIRQLPKSRIAKSADSIRSLVIGSIAEIQQTNDYAAPNTPSPFTRIGPGPSNIIKPDLVFYGGNAGLKDGKLHTSGVPSLSPDGQISHNVGTSFSTPWVSRMASELAFLMDDEFDPLLIRALLIHNSKYPTECNMKMSDKVTQMGFGMPTNVNDMLHNSFDEITLILRDTLEQGSFIQMFDFPYPTSLIDENGYFTGQIIVTLVTKTLVDDKQSGEYCQSNMDVFFGTYADEKNRDTSKPTIKNPKGLDNPQNLLHDSYYSSRAKGIYPKSGFERECTLVKYGKKFHPVKKYAVDLSDITPSNKKRFLKSDRKWYLQIKGLYRNFIEQDAKERNYQLSQEYCLLLTIKDPNGKAHVYDEISAQLSNKNFIHYDIKLRNDVHLKYDGDAQ